MSEHRGETPAEASQEPSEQVRTGMDSVDRVIAAVEELEQRPLEEHVGVYQTAHSELRRALDAHQGGPA